MFSVMDESSWFGGAVSKCGSAPAGTRMGEKCREADRVVPGQDFCLLMP